MAKHILGNATRMGIGSGPLLCNQLLFNINKYEYNLNKIIQQPKWIFKLNNAFVIAALQLRHMSEERRLHITPTRYAWQKFKDTVHFYLMVGLIPVGVLVFYTNVFIGPAQLSPIPEGYVPKHWEYHRVSADWNAYVYAVRSLTIFRLLPSIQHPITRWLARYIYSPPQQDYEKWCHQWYEDAERRQLRILDKQVKELMRQRNDYEAYYYRPATAKYVRLSRDNAEHLLDVVGD